MEAKIDSVRYDQEYTLTFHVTTTEPRYQLVRHEVSAATCTEYGYSQLCYECPGCGKFFADKNAETELDASKVRIGTVDHKRDGNGICENCGEGSEAYILGASGRTYYTTVEAALTAAYENPNNPSVWITNCDRAITLTKFCSVSVEKGVTVPEISTSTADSDATFHIYNDGGTIEKISPAGSGTQTLKITNQGIISNIIIPDNASLSTEITNNGTIGRLEAKKPIKLLSGIGVYNSIYTEGTGLTLGKLLDSGCKFYLIYETEGKKWNGSDYTLQGTSYFIVSTPPFSVTVNGPSELQPDGRGGYSLTLADGAVQDKELTAKLSFPDNETMGLSSKGAGFSYKWYYAGVEEAKWTRAELPLSELAVGVNQLTLRVTDDRYNYTYSTNVTVTITSKDKVPVSLQTPKGSFTKMYDGTAKAPENLPIKFTANGKELVLLPVTSEDEVGYQVVKAAYNSPNCEEAKTITVEVKLTKKAQDMYYLTGDTFKVDGTITKFKPEGTSTFFYMNWLGHTANVGDRMMDHLPTQEKAKKCSHIPVNIGKFRIL